MDDEDIKFYKLLELLGLFSEMGSSLVFVERQEDADKLLKRWFIFLACPSVEGIF